MAPESSTRYSRLGADMDSSNEETVKQLNSLSPEVGFQWWARCNTIAGVQFIRMNSRFCIHQRTAVNLKKRIFQICSFFSVFPLKMIKVSSRIPLSIMSGSYKMLGNLFSTRSKLTSLKDCVVLITGATAGIGEACAWRFADLGSKLVLVGRREERLRMLKNDLLSNYPELDVHTVALSVSDTETVVALPAQLPEKFANVEVLINNAGLGIGVGAADEISVQDARTVLNTNVLGVIAMCRAFIPGMKERGIGHIINMGSISVSCVSFNLLVSHLQCRVMRPTVVVQYTVPPSLQWRPSPPLLVTT